MDFLERAKGLLPIHPKFRLFPAVPLSKFPLIKNFSQEATRDLAKLERWNKRWPNANVAISTDPFLVIDVDNKGEKKGSDELFRLELEGKAFPDTLEQRTPTSGAHLFYEADEDSPFGNGVNKIAPGIDYRGKGGYVLGAGSVLENGVYTFANHLPTLRPPEWAKTVCHQAKVSSPLAGRVLPGVDPERAFERARAFMKAAPPAIQGQGGDQHTYNLICQLKDLGVDQLTSFELMGGEWNENNIPPWSLEDLGRKIENAYRYGREPIGVAAAETQFSEVVEPVIPDPISELNKRFAYIAGSKGFVIDEDAIDEDGNRVIDIIPVPLLHQNEAFRTLTYSGRTVPLTKLWISSPKRRTYNNVCFSPEKKPPPGFYNLWRGFRVEPLSKGEAPSEEASRAVDAFLEHAHDNVCVGDKALSRWLIGYFAHLVQKPWQIPRVALAMKGRKGVGKNALIERVGFLLGDSYKLIASRQQMTGTFNSVLENTILLVLDEAFWSGDKQAEGVLKHLITGERHRIERKGLEAYSVKNSLRVVILGNEDWLVPATEDERRYAVFNVGEGRMQDEDFFEAMRLGMEAGGYRYLLRYLLDFDISEIRVTKAPQTSGLLEQKRNSLTPLGQWWDDCLHGGHIVGSDFGDGWPTTISKERLRSAFSRAVKERNISGRLPGPVHFGRELRKYLPSLSPGQHREDGEPVHTYVMPSLEVARFEWSEHMGGNIPWENET